MGGATSKTELLKNASVQWDKLWTIINGMTDEEQRAEFCFEVTEKDN